MSVYEVRDVVCDYGVFEDGELKLILNSRTIAGKIVELLKEDERRHRELNPLKTSCEGCLHQNDNSGYCLDCYNGSRKT